MIKDYQVIELYSVAALVSAVKRAIEDGWEPIGGLAIPQVGWYSQALVKRA